MEGERLIEEVQKFPVVYDMEDPKYRHSGYKEKVWQIISDRLEVAGGPEECKKKWNSIRDQFRRTLQKRKRKSGKAKRQKYKYEELLGFLLPHVIADRKAASNPPSFDNEREDAEFEPKIEEPELDPASEGQSEVLLDLGPSQSSPISSPGDSQFPRPLKRKRPHFENSGHGFSNQLTEYVLAQKEAEEKYTTNPIIPPQHPVDIFLAGLAPTLKSLNPVLLNQAKSAIFATVQEFELQQISGMSHHSHRLDMTDHTSFTGAAANTSISQSSFQH